MKQPLPDVGCLRPSVAEIKNNWSYTSIPQMPKRRSIKARSTVNVARFVKRLSLNYLDI